MKYLVANWKSHKTAQEVSSWLEAVKKSLWFKSLDKSASQTEVVVCQPVVFLAQCAEVFPVKMLGVQTLSPFPAGAYTGAVAARMVTGMAAYALVGHSERRKYFHETDQEVANQASQALENGLTPIIAVEKANWSSQLALLSEEQLAKCLVMYEPAEAISTSPGAKPVDLDEVIQAVQLIKSSYAVKGVLYGGSVNATNIREYISAPEIDGAVAGAASLDPEEFLSLVSAATAQS